MAFSKWSLRAVCNRSLLPRKRISKTPLLRRALDSGFRRNDGSTTEKRWLRLSPRMVRPLAIAGVYLLLFAACSVTVRPGAPTATPPVESKAQLLATATAVAPTAPDMLERLARECRRYGNCDEPTNWDAIVLALEQRPLQLPDLDEGDACPEPPIRSVEGYLYEVIGEGPVYALFYLLIVSANGNVNYAHDGWHWNKVVWTRDPQYTGPIVIRGRQLNGPETLRFQIIGAGPSPELAHSSLHVPAYTTGNRLDTRGSGWWEEFMTYVVVRAPGCYGVQIDGVGFSTVIVFEVQGPYPTSYD